MDINGNYKHLFEYDSSQFRELLSKNVDMWDLNTKRQAKEKFSQTKSIIYVWSDFKDLNYDNISVELNDDTELTKAVWKLGNMIRSQYGRTAKITKMFFTTLPPQKTIGEHIDTGNLTKIHRVHLPIQTNSGSLFFINDIPINFKENQVVEINNQKSHYVNNNGSSERIHFICDILP
jgi:hypothetical protein